jgi:hypothetical protein
MIGDQAVAVASAVSFVFLRGQKAWRPGEADLPRPSPKRPYSGQHPRRRFLGLAAGAAARAHLEGPYRSPKGPSPDDRRLAAQHPRRQMLTLAAGAAAIPIFSRIASAVSRGRHVASVIQRAGDPERKAGGGPSQRGWLRRTLIVPHAAWVADQFPSRCQAYNHARDSWGNNNREVH